MQQLHAVEIDTLKKRHHEQVATPFKGRLTLLFQMQRAIIANDRVLAAQRADASVLSGML